MKKIFLVILFLTICNIGYSQFSLSGALGYGIRINNDLDYDLFQSSVSVEPQWDFGKLKVSAVALAMNDSTSDFYTGIKPAYQLYQSSGGNTINISLSALQGLEGKQLIGGGVQYEVLNMYFSGDAYHETKQNQFIGNLSFGYYLLR